MFAPHLPIAPPARLRSRTGMEAWKRVTIVDEAGGIERSHFPWLTPQTQVANTLNATRVVNLSGFGWQVLSGENVTLAPGTSRWLAIAREGRTLLLWIAKPEFEADRHARLTCHDGLWSGRADDGIAWIFIGLRDLPTIHSTRRASWTTR